MKRLKSAMNTFVCGFSGAGKSTLLEELQSRNEVDFSIYIDLDKYIWEHFTDQTNSLGDFIRQATFKTFRALEAQAIVKIQKEYENAFIALGGGALGEHTFALLSLWRGYWLDTPFDECYARILDDDNRPLAALPKLELKKIYDQRVLYYKNFQRITSTNELIELI